MGWNVLWAVALTLGVGSGHANTITSDTCGPGVRISRAHDGWLSGCSNLTSGLSGSFSINAAGYGVYDRIAVGFRSGAGQLDPDRAVFELADNTLTGTWSISGQQQLTHAVLYGFGLGPTSAVPKPSMLALVGLGLESLTALRRRRPR